MDYEFTRKKIIGNLQVRNTGKRKGLKNLQSLASGRISISTAFSFPTKSCIVDSGDKSPAYPPYVNTKYVPLHRFDNEYHYP